MPPRGTIDEICPPESGENVMEWPIRKEEWPKALPDFAIDRGNMALLIVDMQLWNASPGAGLGPRIKREFPKISSYYFGRLKDMVIPNQLALLEAFRVLRQKVVFFTLGSKVADRSDVPAIRRMGEMNFDDSQPEFAIIPELPRHPTDLVMNKTTTGAFASTPIDLVLRNLGVSTTVLTGVVTDVCVTMTAREAADRGYKTVIIEDACAAFDEKSHLSSLPTFRRSYGLVMTTEEFLRGIGR